MIRTDYFPAPVAWDARRAAFTLPATALYLDAASKGARLSDVQQAAHAALDLSATPWRLPHEAVVSQMEHARALAAALLFDADTEGVAMVPSAAYALATAARNVPLQRGDAVLVLEGQFPSNLLIWQQRCREVGAQLVAAAPAPGQSLTEAVLDRLAQTPGVAVVTLPLCYWQDGRLLDLDRIAPVVHAAGAALVLDLSQSAGVLPIDLQRWQPDFVVTVGYKWLLGSIGLAWLWASPRWRSEGLPIEHHWLGRDAGTAWSFPVASAPSFMAGARRFDAGASNDPVRLTIAAVALAQLQHWGLARVAAALGEITAALDVALDARGLSSWKTPGHAPHITGLRVPGERLDAVAAAFSAHEIICSRRGDCLRLSPYLTVRPEQLQQVVDIAANA